MARLVCSIAGAVMFLPRWIPRVHNTLVEPVTTGYGNAAKEWSPDVLLHMVDQFVRVAQVRCTQTVGSIQI